MTYFANLSIPKQCSALGLMHSLYVRTYDTFYQLTTCEELIMCNESKQEQESLHYTHKQRSGVPDACTEL